MTENGNEWQRMTASGPTSDDEWYKERQQVTTNENEWKKLKQVTMSGHFN